MKIGRITRALGEIDEAYIQEVFDYKKSERSKFTMSKKKLFSIALAAAIAMISAVMVAADSDILPRIESKCLGISHFIPLKTEHAYLKMTPPDKRYTKLTYDESGHATISIDKDKNFAIGNALEVRLRNNGEMFFFEKGDKFKVRIEVDLNAEGIKHPEGVYLEFGRIWAVDDKPHELKRFDFDDDVNGVLEFTYEIPMTNEYDFYIMSNSSDFVHVKSISIEKIS